MKAAAETTMRLLDLLELHDEWNLVESGEVWPVRDSAAECIAGAEAADRGPVVAIWKGNDAGCTVIALGEEGRPSELVGIHAWNA